MKVITLIVLLFATSTALAQDALLVTLGSRHYDSAGRHATDMNEFNPGLSVKQGLTEHLYSDIGFYKNSFRRTTIYGGVGYQLNQYLTVEGVVGTGYKGHTWNHNVTPMVYPVLRTPEFYGMRLRFIYMPSISADTLHVFGVQLEHKL